MSIPIEMLKGLVLESVTVNPEQDRITFKTTCGRQFLMYHQSDCCESVDIESIEGDLADLIGEPILLAEEATSCDGDIDVSTWSPDARARHLIDPIVFPHVSGEPHTWTFYKLATRKGYVDIRWFGESNGYYSESVDFVETTHA